MENNVVCSLLGTAFLTLYHDTERANCEAEERLEREAYTTKPQNEMAAHRQIKVTRGLL
jgi:hypothetical protein